jgi:hypothetical protein
LLSSTDWTTFNGKQNALTNPVTGTGTTNYLAKFTGTSTVGNSALFDGGGFVGFNNTGLASRTFVINAASGRPLALEAVEFANIHSIYLRPNNSGFNLLTSNYITGGVFLPLSLSGRENNADLVLQTNGNVTINTTTDSGFKLDINGTGRFANTLNAKSFLPAYAASTLANQNSGIIFTNGTITNAFGFVVQNGLFFQGDNSLTNSVFGVKSPTADGSLGATVFSVSSVGAGIFNSHLSTLGNFTTNGFGFISPATGNAILQITRTSTGNGAGLALYTTGTLNWLVGTAWGETSSNYIVYNGVTGTQSFKIDSATNVATFTNKVGVGGAAATYSLTAYNASNGTTVAFGGTAKGIRIDNDGVNSSGRSTIFGVDSSFYGSYQPLSIEASSLTLQSVTGGNVGIGTASPNKKLEVTTGNGTTNGIRLTYAAGITGEGMDITYLNTGNTTTSFDSIYNSDSAIMQFRMKTGGTAVTAMTILGSGNIMIATTTDSGDKLRVNGTTFTNEIMTLSPEAESRSAINWRLGAASIGTIVNNRRLRVKVGGVEYYIGAVEV